jgi:small-conductance mechanosensitive channel
VASIPGLIVVAVILLLAQAMVGASNAMFRAIAQREIAVPRIHPETASATRRLAVLVIWACALVAAYPYLPGSNSDVFKGLSVLIGAMVTLGTTGIVNQLMSGLVLVYSRALRAGDYVVVGEQEGVVAEVGTLATKLVTMRNEEITIPNAVIVSSPIKNYSKLSDAQGTLLSTRVTIGYDAPWRQVHALLLEGAGRTAGLRAAPAPYVLQRALSDFYVEYELFANIDKPLERLPVLSALHANIQDAFNAAGVQIMSPHYVEQPGAPVLAPAKPRTPAA